jgi:DNA-binding CsgD family transcriptional regulator
MSSKPLQHIVPAIYDAALKPELWPRVLQLLTEAAGAIGGAYILSNNRTGEVEWASFCGPSVEFKPDYLTYYAALDPYRPVCDAAPTGSLVRLSQSVPAADLRKDEWYNDFVTKCGVREIVGARLAGDFSRTAILGVHYGIHQPSSASGQTVELQKLLEPLNHASRLHIELHNFGWKSSAALRALDQLATGIFITQGNRRVVELNRAADGIIRRNDGLTIRNGNLRALRAFEDAKLATLIAGAAPAGVASTAGRMLIGSGDGRGAYIVSVTPLEMDVAGFDRPLVMVLAAAPYDRLPSELDLAELFGLSRAETRLALGLLQGKKLRDIAADTGLRITTLRTQLSSMLKKVAAERQADLIRVLSSIPVAGR